MYVIQSLQPTFLKLIPGQLRAENLTTSLINTPHPLITDVFDPTSVFHAYLLCKSTFSLFCLIYTFGALAYPLKFFNTFIVKMAFSLLLLCCWCYTSHLVEIASNYQLTRMVENFDVRVNKVVGSHAGAKIVGLKFLSAKKCLRTAFVVL